MRRMEDVTALLGLAVLILAVLVVGGGLVLGLAGTSLGEVVGAFEAIRR
jgi:hypothetical protein